MAAYDRVTWWRLDAASPMCPRFSPDRPPAVELRPEPYALTGTMGAGKLVLIHALGFALGPYAESGMIRPDAARLITGKKW